MLLLTEVSGGGLGVRLRAADARPTMMDDYAVAQLSSEEEFEEEEPPAPPLAQARAAPSTWARGPRAPGGAALGSEEGAEWGWLQAFPPRAARREPAPGGGAAQQALDRELGLLARAMGAPPPASPPAPTSRAALEGRVGGESDHTGEDTTEDMEEDEDGAAAERAQGSVQASAAGAPDGASARPGAGGGRDADSEDEEEAAERLAAAAAAAGLLDETADDIDRKWVDANLRDGGSGGAAGRKRASDALLSCPGCFTSLCFDCRAIGRGGREFRAERALNCERDGSELRCGECSTTVGSVDVLGAVTFTNVLPSAI